MHENIKAVKGFEAEWDYLIAEVMEGLRKPQKELPCKLFYDERGSLLFDEICGLKEYYLTRTEMAIMDKYISEISDTLGSGCLLIELGSGSSKKIRLILDHLEEPAGYMPIDISFKHLMKSVSALARDYPRLRIVPVYADYTQPFSLPRFYIPYSRKVVYFPGSTIGNFTREYAGLFLERIARLTGGGSGLLIGVDLKKDKRTLEAAYNDGKGVTAAFNLNMLERLNRELGADFDLSRWRHHAFYNDGVGRIEMHLVSLEDQYVHIGDGGVFFEKGETILTEYSYKYTLEEFRELVSDAFRIERVWTDEKRRFSVQYLSVR
ncbi:MAG TPA: L-histidine N(alpha)-methyltransferase [Thermodesulfobacteriota bacterium]|jgi:dimethylhistidine N-methyltransferase|nr:L-histidine N(alpha)-methyltransferase [Thermodesulfobacteriota bacterium]